MTTPDLDDLNSRFAADSQVHFATQHGLVVAQLANRHGSATVALSGGQVLTYQPVGQQPVLFVAQQARYEVGKSVRGGIPVCWPWFAGRRDDPARPFHGFARMLVWGVRAAHAAAESTTLELGLTENTTTRAYWPHPFDLRLVVTLGRTLQVDLIARNTDTQPVELTAALHSYFRVGDVAQVTLHGLEGTTFIDKTNGDSEQHEASLAIDRWIDRIYLDTTATCSIDDASLKRRIVIEKAGSRATVVWNPWRENAAAIADMGDDEYRAMLCVETANTGGDTITLAPGHEHQLSAIIHVGPR